MKFPFLSFLLLLSASFSFAGGSSQDTSKASTSKCMFLNASFQSGVVLPTNDFIINSEKKPTFSSASLKFGFASTGDRWEDYAYGMPYAGAGVYWAQFFDEKSLGKPFALYAFQGGILTKIARNLTLNYEWNLGASFNWKPYDPFDNPENISLGSSMNAYAALNFYFRWQCQKRWDFDLGFAVSHFSNGASHLPNKGLNLISGLLSVNYKFNDLGYYREKPASIIIPKVAPHFDYEVLVNISSRQRRFDTTGTKLPSEYVDKNFGVYGLTVATMYVKSLKYKYGLGVDFLYDESSNARAWREINPADGKLYDRISLAPFGERLSLGGSLRGELTFPSHALFANLGYNFINGNHRDKRLYQILGVKVYLKENLFGTFGIRANNFSKAQYLYWSLGYTFDGNSKGKIRNNFAASLR